MLCTILGAPGAGKGTQALFLKEKLGVPIIATGNLLRDAMKAETELGKSIKDAMNSGHLVPDDLIVDLVSNRLAEEDCKNGAILDGFPRTLFQAEAIDKIFPVDFALSIEVSDEEIISRLTGREICTKCQATYHVEYNPTSVPGVCDRCGALITRRNDDDREIVKERLVVYHKETEPVKKYYEDLGKLKKVIGQREVVDTQRLVAEAVGVEYDNN